MRRAALLLALLLAGCTTPEHETACARLLAADPYLTQVTHIVDGDTLDVACGGRMRLALVDTPERGEPGFDEATAFAARTCPVGGDVIVDLDAGQPTDTTGTRRVAKLTCGGVNLNAALVVAEHATFLTRFCGVSEFAREPWASERCALEG